MVLVSVFAFLLIIGSIVFFSVRGQIKAAKATAASALANSSINKFAVFAGSKGPVIWLLEEQEISMRDSVHYYLHILNPQTKAELKVVEFIQPMTWDDNFDASKFIGTFYSFGDTCWITSEHDVLSARDIYSGKIISTVNQLGNSFPQFSKGITKADWGYSAKYFNITSNDGFDFVFVPDAKKVFTKEEWDKTRDQTTVTRNFFVLTDGKRPLLFKSQEKTSPFSTSSKTFSSDLEKYDPNKRAWGLSDDVIAITPILPDKVFFNGFVEYCDNTKAIIMYQNSISKKSEVHIMCVNADGKQLWDISGKEVQAFKDVFSNNNRGVEFTYSPTGAIFYEEYSDHHALGVDWKTGNVLWSYSTEKKQ